MTNQVIAGRTGIVIKAADGSIIGTGGIGVTYATQVAVTLSAASGAIGSPVTATYTPVGGDWPVATGTATTTLTGAFGTPVLSPSIGTTTPVTAVFTPSAANVGSIGGTFAGMTIQGGVGATYTASASSGPATAYTVSLPGSAGSVNAPATALVTPNGTWPSGATVTLALSGATATLGNPSGATLSGSVLTPTGTGAFTVDITPTATGKLTVTPTNSAGLGNPTASTFTVSAVGSAPPALSGLTFTQAAPLSADAGGYTMVGYLDPIGGIGPFTFSNSGGLTNSNYERRDAGQVDIYIYSGDISTVTNKTTTFTVTDGRGATFTTAPIAFTVDTVNTLTFNNRTTWPNVWADGRRGGPLMRHPYGDGLQILDQSTGTTSTHFVNEYGSVVPIDFNIPAPVGTYPVTLSISGRTINKTIIVENFTPISYIELIPNTLSTAAVPSTFIGRAAATTPSNSPVWSINDPSGILQIDTGGYVTVRSTPSATGPITFSITVSDNRATYTQSFTITVVAGNVLASSAMSTSGMTLAFNNVTGNNVLGSPTVTGVTGTPVWRILTQPNNFGASTGGDRYLINSSTGAITTTTQLSAGVGDITTNQIDTLTISVSDGVNTCSHDIAVTVNWGAIVRTIYVGRGMAAAHGADGFEHLANAEGDFHYRGIGNGVWQCLIYADADPAYYNGDVFGANYIGGSPTIIIGVAANGYQRPIFGPPGGTGTYSWGTGASGKGAFVFGGSDSILRNIEGYGINDQWRPGDQGGGGSEFVHYESGSHNDAIQNCVFHASANNIFCGEYSGTLLIEHTELRGGGDSHRGPGQTHNAYLSPYHLIFRNNVTRHAGYGHDLKTRAVKTEVYGNRFFDGIFGRAAAVLELPNGGDVEVYNNVFEKGDCASGPNCIQYAAETCPYAVNNLNVHNNTISVLRQPGNHDGAGSAVGMFPYSNPFGVQPTMQFTNNQVFLAPGDALITMREGGPAIPTNESGTTYLSLPPLLDMTSPTGDGTQMVTEIPYFRGWSDDSLLNFINQQQYGDREQIRVSATAATGTVILNIHASNDLGAQGDGATPNPYVAGTAWSIITGGIYYPEANPNPWAPTGKYTITTNGDGSAALKTGSGTFTANSLDYVQVRAVAPNGSTSDHRYPIMVTA